MFSPVIGLNDWRASSLELAKVSPIDGSLLCSFYEPDSESVGSLVEVAARAQKKWCQVPLPKRESLLLGLREVLEKNKAKIVDAIQLEVGKIRTEAEGEVQEALDMLTFCLGLSRTLGGTIFPSERPNHFMFETWHPLGVVGIISAFNFPVAVWAWNAFLAVTCGNATIWKPSELTPLSSFLVCSAANSVAESLGYGGLFNLIVGGKEVGKKLASHPGIALVSATGSVEMGRDVAQMCAARFSKIILELGGNNAVIVHNDCDIEQALNFCFFGIVGTAGQRCTSIRRLIIHQDVYDTFVSRLVEKLQMIRIGDPREAMTTMGPLISETAVVRYLNAIEKGLAEGGKLLCGGERLKNMPSDLYVTPTLIELSKPIEIVSYETFAPIVWCFRYATIDEAINLNNSVPQGLSSACFSQNLNTAFRFIQSSDCGLANINTSTSGAEIGVAFGGEKLTGGGREAGSDCWKFYMRRQSCVINWGGAFALSQSVKLD